MAASCSTCAARWRIAAAQGGADGADGCLVFHGLNAAPPSPGIPSPAPAPGAKQPPPAPGTPRLLSDLLVARELVDPATMKSALQATLGGRTLSAVLVEDGHVGEHDLSRALAERHGHDLDAFEAAREAAEARALCAESRAQAAEERAAVAEELRAAAELRAASLTDAADAAAHSRPAPALTVAAMVAESPPAEAVSTPAPQVALAEPPSEPPATEPVATAAPGPTIDIPGDPQVPYVRALAPMPGQEPRHGARDAKSSRPRSLRTLVKARRRA